MRVICKFYRDILVSYPLKCDVSQTILSKSSILEHSGTSLLCSKICISLFKISYLPLVKILDKKFVHKLFVQILQIRFLPFIYLRSNHLVLMVDLLNNIHITLNMSELVYLDSLGRYLFVTCLRTREWTGRKTREEGERRGG